MKKGRNLDSGNLDIRKKKKAILGTGKMICLMAMGYMVHNHAFLLVNFFREEW